MTHSQDGDGEMVMAVAVVGTVEPGTGVIVWEVVGGGGGGDEMIY